MTASLADLRGQVLDSFQPLTIFVAFVTVLFGLRYPTIAAGITKTLPDTEMEQARKNEKDALRRLLWSQCVPLTVLVGLPTYLFVPLALRIMRHDEFTLWNFDTLKTGFVLLTAYMLATLGWAVSLSVRLAVKTYSQ